MTSTIKVTKSTREAVARDYVEQMLEDLKMRRAAYDVDADPWDYAEEKQTLDKQIREWEIMQTILNYDKEHTRFILTY